MKLLLGWATLGALVGLLFGAINNRNPESLGIYKPDNPNAVFIVGEACTVNMRAKDDPDEVQYNLLWCLEKYEAWIEQR